MIRRTASLIEFERSQARQGPVDYQRNLRIYGEMIAWARTVGAWPPRDPLAGFEDDIRYAKSIHVPAAYRQVHPHPG